MPDENTEKSPPLPKMILSGEEAPQEKNGAEAKGNGSPIETHKIEGFLVPEFYRRQTIYRTHPLFRTTLLVLVLAVCVGASGGYQWMLASKLKKTVMATQRLEVGESTRLQNESLFFKSTREKYRELEILQKQLRVPLAPILNAIEKSIPKEISINEFAMTCQPVASTGTAKRIASIRLMVFFPDGVAPTDPAINTWPEKIQESLTARSKGTLKLRRPEWGAQQNLIIPKTDRADAIKGWTRPLTFTVELDAGKL